MTFQRNVSDDSPLFTMGSMAQKTPAEKFASLFKPASIQAARVSTIVLSVPPSGYPVEVVDVSYWQGSIDWYQLALQAQAVYIRAGYGSSGVDPLVFDNVTGAEDADIPYGLYWYVKPNNGTNWKDHIDSFYAIWKDYGGELPPVWDVEYTALNKNDTSNWLTKLAKNWEDKTGIAPMIYTRASWWNYYTARMDWPKLLDLWVAHYTSASQPLIPDDWGKVANPRTWTLWQWSADGNGLGDIYGVESASIDRNRFNGSIDDFNKKYKTNITATPDIPPAPPPVDPPVDPPAGDWIEPMYRVKVTASALNVRGGPGVEYSDLGELISQTVMPVTDEVENWLHVEGWVHKNYVKRV